MLFLLLLLPPAAQAQEGLTLEVTAGFDSFLKTEQWSIVRVTVENRGPDQKVALQIRQERYGSNTALYSYPLDLPNQSRKQVTFHIPAPYEARLTVDVVDDRGQELLSAPLNIELLTPADFLVGVVASDGSLLNGLAGLNTPNGDRVAVAHLDLADLPESLQAWSTLNMLVFNDVDTTPLSEGQQAALRHWVSQGGRLVVGGGPNAAQTIAGLTPLLPFDEVRQATWSHPLTGLERFINNDLANRGPYIAAIPTDRPTAAMPISQENEPLALVTELGQGRVHYLALDLSLAPLDTLGGQDRFLPRLVNELEPQFGALTNNNINQNQMRTSLALIPDQTLPTPGTIALYLGLYVLMIGPVNYFVLGRFRRRELSWLTLPLIILLFCGVGYVSGFRLRGGQPLLRQIAVVRAEVGVPVAEADTFAGIYSPWRTRYSLAVEGAALVRPISTDSFNQEIRVVAGDATRIEELQADIGGMPTVLIRSQVPAPAIQADIRYDRSSHILAGTIFNGTEQPITEAHLLIEDRVLRLETLPPGETTVDAVTRTHNYGSFYNTNQAAPNTPEALTLASRDTAMQAVFDYNPYYYGGPSPNQTPTTRTQGDLYLTGWQEGSPVSLTLPGQSSDEMSETLLLVRLPLGQ